MTPRSFKAAIMAVCLVCLMAVPRAVAQEKQAPLPDINVTAPAAPNGSFITRGFTSPFVGHTRVEEDKWPVIPCTTSRISSVVGGTCQTGAPTQTWMSLRSEARLTLGRLHFCRTYSHVGCCDGSQNRHASAHFHATRHPIIEGYDPPEC
jgi:hypothetical protein